MAWDLWEHRNGIVHRATVNSGYLRRVQTAIRVQMAIQEQLSLTLQQQLSFGPACLAPSDLPHFNSGPGILQQGPPEMQVAWFANVLSKFLC
jgi:hypothetical protein